MSIDFKGDTLKYYKKDRNGDHFIIEELTTESILICVLADGISRQPCDWKASEMACQGFVKEFVQNKALDAESRIKVTVQNVNQAICSVVGECENLCTTLSVIVYERLSERCFIASIGDSRIYRVRNDHFELLTIDDSIKNEKVIMASVGRRVVDASVLTQFLGNPTIEFSVEEIDFQKNDLLISASDGFYEARKSGFDRDMLKLSQEDDVLTGFNANFERYGWSTKDDMTAIVLKKR